MKSKLLLTILFACAQAFMSAQVAGLKIGDNPGVIDPASVLELESSTRVFVPTRVTTGQLNAITPLDGALAYNITEAGLFYYDNGSWSAIRGLNEVGDNIFAGELAGNANTTGQRNAAYGFRSFRLNTSGSNNSALGFHALRDANANNNSAFGAFALRVNSAGGNNSGFGVNALRDNNSSNNSSFGMNSLTFNVSGSGNSAFGVNALRDNNSGDNNSFGVNSLRFNVNGTGNSAFGINALRENIDGNNNVAVGNDAGRRNEDGSSLTDVENSVFIGNGARSQANGQDNQIVIGNGAIGNGVNTVTIGNGNITDNFFNGNVDITGEFRVNGTPISGGGPITGLTNPLVEDLDAAGFDIINLNFLGMNDGRRNVFIGEGTGEVNTTGQSNFALGFRAFDLNESGTSNVAIGDQTMANSLSGNLNTAVGNQALFDNDGDRNVAIGHRSLFENDLGANNTGVGANAIRQIEGGSGNTAIGSAAGRFIAAGTPNQEMNQGVLIGAETRALSSGGTNETVIGYAAVGNGSNTVTIGNSNVTDVHFGNGYIFSGDAAPASSSAPGETGEIRIDSNFIYVCVAPNSWVRAALSSW